MTKRPSIYDYNIENNILYYKQNNKYLVYFCMKIENSSDMNNIYSLNLQKYKKSQILHCIFYFPLKNEIFLWLFTKKPNLQNVEIEIEKIAHQITPIPTILKQKDLINAFFIQKLYQNSNILIEDNENENYFEISEDTGIKTYIYQIVVKRKKEKNLLEPLSKISEYFQTAKFTTSFQLNLHNLDLFEANIIFNCDTIIKKNILQSYIESLGFSEFFDIQKMDLKNFRRYLKKEPLSKPFKIKTDNFLLLLKKNGAQDFFSPKINNLSDFQTLEKNFLNNLHKIVKISDETFSYDQNLLIYFLHEDNISDLIKNLQPYYKKCLSFVIIVNSEKLFTTIKTQTSISELEKITIYQSNKCNQLRKKLQKHLQLEYEIQENENLSLIQ